MKKRQALRLTLVAAVTWILCGWFGHSVGDYRQELADDQAATWVDSVDNSFLLRGILDNAGDETWRTDVIGFIKVLGLHEGDVVADVGCGLGAHSLRMARAVGGTGRVWAVDIDADRVRYVSDRIRMLGLRNVRTVQSTPTSTNLGPASVDHILLCDVLHCFLGEGNQDDEGTFQVLTRPFLLSMRSALRPRGTLLVYDSWQGPARGERVHGRAVRRAFERCGYRLVSMRGRDDSSYELLYESAEGEPEPPSRARGLRIKARHI